MGRLLAFHIGVNVIPADTRNKKPLVPWLSYQDKRIQNGSTAYGKIKKNSITVSQ